MCNLIIKKIWNIIRFKCGAISAIFKKVVVRPESK